MFSSISNTSYSVFIIYLATDKCFKVLVCNSINLIQHPSFISFILNGYTYDFLVNSFLLILFFNELEVFFAHNLVFQLFVYSQMISIVAI